MMNEQGAAEGPTYPSCIVKHYSSQKRKCIYHSCMNESPSYDVEGKTCVMKSICGRSSFAPDTTSMQVIVFKDG